MKTFISLFLFCCVVVSVNAQSLDPLDILKQDGVLRISDGSSYYEFNTNGVFKSFPVGISGRCFDGTWTSSTDTHLLHFTVKAKMGWMNGIQPPPDDWKIIFTIYPGVRRPAERFHQAIFDCYWIIDELTKIPKPETPN
jgi:hypothetical protein